MLTTIILALSLLSWWFTKGITSKYKKKDTVIQVSYLCGAVAMAIAWALYETIK